MRYVSWDETLDKLREALYAGVDASMRENQLLKRQNQDDSNSLPQHLNN